MREIRELTTQEKFYAIDKHRAKFLDLEVDINNLTIEQYLILYTELLTEKIYDMHIIRR